jgi:hypothetical protein
MQNRMEIYKVIKQNFTVNGISKEKADELIKIFDNLKQKVVRNQANITDVELLVQKIIDLTEGVDSEHSILVTKNLCELSKHYMELLPFLMKTYKEAYENQIKYVNHENLEDQVQNSKVFTKYLKTVLIQPMLLNEADITQNYFISEHFGKIPIISMDETDIHSTKELSTIDSFLEDNMDREEEHNGKLSALQPYVLTFSYLNKESVQISTPSTSKTFINYLVESASPNQPITSDSRAPKLIFAASDVIRMFLSNTNLNHHLNGTTLKDEKIILISIDKKNYINEIAASIIHEIQHLLNTYFFNGNNLTDYSKVLSNSAINTFIKFTDTIKFDQPLFTEIVKDIHKIFDHIAQYEQSDRDLDELSAHLMFLLFTYPEILIREVINVTLSKIAEALHETVNSNDEILAVCKAISKSLDFIEHAINHLSFALLNFKANNINEFFDKTYGNDPNFGQQSTLMKQITEILTSNIVSWDLKLQAIRVIEFLSEMMINVTFFGNSRYSLHEQVKTGNDIKVKHLLQISKSSINKVDENKYSLLSYAVMNNHLSTFKLLMQFGASLEWKGNIGKVKNSTILHIATHFGSFELIPILLHNGLSATTLDGNEQTPLVLLTRFITSKSYQDTLKNNIEINELYNSSIRALAYLLSYSNDQQVKSNNPGNNFYNSLIEFRKNIATLYVLHESGALRLTNFNLSDHIIHNIALQFNDDVPCKDYKSCYRDICLVLIKNKLLFNQFVKLGMQSAYNDLQAAMHNSKNPLNAIKRKLFSTSNSHNSSSSSKVEKKQLLNYYSPTNIFFGAQSLSAVMFAKKQLRAKSNRTFFQEDKHKGRRSAIDEWKMKVDSNAGEGLWLAIIRVCNNIGITQIDNQLYHKLSMILTKLVIKDNKTPTKCTPQLFEKEFKDMYQETTDSEKTPVFSR